MTTKSESKRGATESEKAAPMIEGPKLVRKITIKTVCGDVKDRLTEIINAKGQPVWLMEVYAQTAKYKAGQTDTGEYIKFYGDFLGVRLADGAEFAGGSCILPNFVAEQIAARMVDPATGEMSVAQFAFRIGAHYEKTAATSYVFDVVPLMPAGTKTPAALLRDSLTALPAPKTAEV